MPDEILAPHAHLSDPHRLWPRRTYQEGPGSRFLATAPGGWSCPGFVDYTEGDTRGDWRWYPDGRVELK